MEWKDFGSLYDPKRGGELCYSFHLVGNIGQAWDQDVAQPHGMPQSREPLAELDDAQIVGNRRHAFVLRRTKCFHIENYKIYIREFGVRKPFGIKSIGFNR